VKKGAETASTAGPPPQLVRALLARIFRKTSSVRIECPKCGGTAAADKSFPELLKLAESGQLDFFCTECGQAYKPGPADQRRYAEELGRMIA